MWVLCEVNVFDNIWVIVEVDVVSFFVKNKKVSYYYVVGELF